MFIVCKMEVLRLPLFKLSSISVQHMCWQLNLTVLFVYKLNGSNQCTYFPINQTLNLVSYCNFYENVFFC